MRWLRLAGFLRLYVSFVEYSLFYRALLQKRPIILRSLLIIATPYVNTLSYAQVATHTHTYNRSKAYFFNDTLLHSIYIYKYTHRHIRVHVCIHT